MRLHSTLPDEKWGEPFWLQVLGTLGALPTCTTCTPWSLLGSTTQVAQEALGPLGLWGDQAGPEREGGEIEPLQSGGNGARLAACRELRGST